MKSIIRGINDILYGTKNLILRATSELLKPRWLWFEVTDRCNSHCIQCNIWRKKPTEDVLTPEEIEKTLSDSVFRDVEGILNSGGEPILRDDLEQIILAEHKALPKAKIQLSTNGLLPERIIDVVKSTIKHNINIYVGTSLYAIGEEHDSIRGIKGNFKKVDWLLHELVVLRETYGNVFPTFGYLLLDRTLPHLEEVIKYAQELKIDFVIQWYSQSLFYNNIGRELVSNKEAMIKAVQSCPDSIVNEMGIKWLKGESIEFQCFALYTFCMLHCNGDISPCLGFWDTEVGNVRESSPTQIWHNANTKRARKVIKDCRGCLDACGVIWSSKSSFYPYLLFYLQHKVFGGLGFRGAINP